MDIETLPTPNYIRGRNGHIPRGIIVHTTVGSYEGTAAWFANPLSKVSAHYLVALDARIAQFVPEEDAARHARRVTRTTALVTDESPYLYTIGIEFEDGGDSTGVHRPAAQYRAGADLLRDIAARWQVPLDRAHVIGHREIANTGCPGNLDIERLLAEARAPARSFPVLVCLLPARNAAALLPGYLESVARVADAVVALDDGSSDQTAEILERHPLVKILLSNPRRESFRGWDDAANRNRLLAAAAELEPDWIISLDADERMDAEDAQALRDFVAGDALPGCAFGFQHFRMWEGGLYDPNFHWIYRLFAHGPGQRLADQRPHFDPIPTSIRDEAWVDTTLRLQHFGAASEEERLARLAKYCEADPDDEFGADFAGLASRPRPDKLAVWQQRPEGLPVLYYDDEGPRTGAECAAARYTDLDSLRNEPAFRQLVG